MIVVKVESAGQSRRTWAKPSYLSDAGAQTNPIRAKITASILQRPKVAADPSTTNSKIQFKKKKQKEGEESIKTDTTGASTISYQAWSKPSTSSAKTNLQVGKNSRLSTKPRSVWSRDKNGSFCKRSAPSLAEPNECNTSNLDSLESKQKISVAESQGMKSFTDTAASVHIPAFTRKKLRHNTRTFGAHHKSPTPWKSATKRQDKAPSLAQPKGSNSVKSDSITNTVLEGKVTNDVPQASVEDYVTENENVAKTKKGPKKVSVPAWLANKGSIDMLRHNANTSGANNMSRTPWKYATKRQDKVPSLAQLKGSNNGNANGITDTVLEGKANNDVPQASVDDSVTENLNVPKTKKAPKKVSVPTWLTKSGKISSTQGMKSFTDNAAPVHKPTFTRKQLRHDTKGPVVISTKPKQQPVRSRTVHSFSFTKHHAPHEWRTGDQKDDHNLISTNEELDLKDQNIQKRVSWKIEQNRRFPPKENGWSDSFARKSGNSKSSGFKSKPQQKGDTHSLKNMTKDTMRKEVNKLEEDILKIVVMLSKRMSSRELEGNIKLIKNQVASGQYN